MDRELEGVLVKSGFNARTVEMNPSVIYIINSRFQLVYCNRAWDIFAIENGGKNLERQQIVGMSALEISPGFLRNFYESRFSVVLENQNVSEHSYECSSPNVYRRFNMRILPLGRKYLMIENSLFVERPHGPIDGGPASFDVSYVDDDGFITMCANCRRTLAFDFHGRTCWHWVPSYLVSAPAPICHGLCSTCLAYYYKLSIMSSS